MFSHVGVIFKNLLQASSITCYQKRFMIGPEVPQIRLRTHFTLTVHELYCAICPEGIIWITEINFKFTKKV